MRQCVSSLVVNSRAQLIFPSHRYLGGRDEHETAYDKYMKYSLFKDLDQYSISDRKYSGAPLNNDFCPYWIKVYPSDEMKGDYTTNDPIIFTVVAVVSSGYPPSPSLSTSRFPANN